MEVVTRVSGQTMVHTKRNLENRGNSMEPEITLQPLIQTPNGEALSVRVGECVAGDLQIVYQKQQLLRGALYLDHRYVKTTQIARIAKAASAYVQELADDLDIPEGKLFLTYGPVNTALEWDHAIPDHGPDLTFDPEWDVDESGDAYELSVISREKGHTKYHLLNERGRVMGLVAADESDHSVSGRVDFWLWPEEEQVEEVTRLLTRRFANGQVSRVAFTMSYEDRPVGDLYLEYHDFSR
jgi:hypothetical protein